MSKKKLSKGVTIFQKDLPIELFTAGKVSIFGKHNIPHEFLKQAEKGLKVGEYTLVTTLKKGDKTVPFASCSCWGDSCSCYWDCGNCYCDTVGLSQSQDDIFSPPK